MNLDDGFDESQKLLATSKLGTTVLKFNIGGTSYCFRLETLKTKNSDSKLGRFAQCSHDARLCICDAFLPEQNEYFFERSPKLFETIFKFYTTGVLHRPLDICDVEFHEELSFWRIPDTNLASCCWPKMSLAPWTNGTSYDENGHLVASKADSIEDLTLKTKTADGDESLKQRIYRFCEGDGTCMSAVFTTVSISFVLISVLGLILGSIRDFQVQIPKPPHELKNGGVGNLAESDFLLEPHPFFNWLEIVCIAWFTAEYILRFTVAPKKLSFVFEMLNIVDLIAILPFFLELILAVIGIDVSSLSNMKGAFLVVRILRVLRVVRILKLGRYSSGMRTFALTLRSSARQLGMMGMVLCTGVIFFSTLIYYVEKDEPNTQFYSIPAAFWFVLVTMTTVGYGDSVPVTIPGKLIATGAIVSGVLVLALPITIIVDNFMKVSGNPSSPFAHSHHHPYAHMHSSNANGTGQNGVHTSRSYSTIHSPSPAAPTMPRKVSTGVNYNHCAA